MIDIIQHRTSSIMKGFKMEIKSAVAIVCKLHEGKFCYLLARSTDEDDRQGKLCFLGGGVDKGETPLLAAIREACEEGGVVCTPTHISMITHPTKPTVGFFVLHCHQDSEVTINEEFSEYRWVSFEDKYPEDMMELNKEVLKIINK